ncbi:putative leucine-rich repeat receptor-like serine/threonine-protein kinase, partial [Mucuna pruriens]
SYFFHINCGGDKITIGDTTYDGDSNVDTASISSIQTKAKWAVSNTGHLLDNTFKYDYITQNTSRLSMTDAEAKLYMNARISPLSLTYYGFCLQNGNYTVKLHFAEIIFTDDNTYTSLGRRVFDVYIQGKRVLKDFNIANKAQGTGKAYIKNFTAYVSNTALEIRFSWAGKGSTGIPNRSMYGPLISAISVTSDSKPPSPSSRNSIPTWVVVVIVVATSIILILVVGILWWRFCLKNNNSLAIELKDLDLKTGLFTLRQIKVATNNFNISNKIGEGGFGPVYKGILWDGTMIAVKQLSSKSRQGNREFINEIGLISALQHPCLVKLYGCCIEGDQLLLVYEYLENNSLAHALFGHEESCVKLDWSTRQKICIGIARGLAFLHEESTLKVVHRDIKATNWIYGSEYAMHGYLTDKADVYSFGIVALEIVSGKSNTIHRSKEETLCLLDLAHLLKEEAKLMELVDKRLGLDFNEEEVMVMINVALLCTNVTSNLRPTMSSVVSMLEGNSMVPEFVSNTSEVMDEMKLEAMRQYYNQIAESNINVTQSQNLSIEGHWTASSSSATDLYPVDLNSSYWETRKLRDSV